MVPYFRIFGFTVQAYGLLFLIAIWTGLEVVLRQARRLGLEANHISNLVFYALGATVFWAHVWFTWSPTGLLTGVRFSLPFRRHLRPCPGPKGRSSAGW